MLTVDDICKAAQGEILQLGNKKNIKNICIDSRTITPQDGFIAIKGLTHDGHKFVLDVIRRGVRLVIVSQKVKVPKSVSVIYVEDTTIALGQIAHFHRKRFSIPVIAITGSVGKTTTKDLVAHVLSGKYNVLKNNKSENNHIGVPLTLLRLTSQTDVAVIEMGTNQPGDIRYLTRIVLPTMAVFTNIGESHLERLKNCRGVLKEKLNLLKGFPSAGKVVFNADDLYLKAIRKIKSAWNLRTCSIKNKSQLQARNIKIEGINQISFDASGGKYQIKTSVYENVYNALFAISCGRLLEMSYNDIKRRLFSFNFSNSRQQMIRHKNIWVINDSYNANPVSFRSAVNTLSNLPVKGRKFLVCGDMLELGKKSKHLHRKVGESIQQSSVDFVFSFGEMAKEINRVVSRSQKFMEAAHFKDVDVLNKTLKARIKNDDVVLVKGSRGMKMERVVDYLTKR